MGLAADEFWCNMAGLKGALPMAQRRQDSSEPGFVEMILEIGLRAPAGALAIAVVLAVGGLIVRGTMGSGPESVVLRIVSVLLFVFAGLAGLAAVIGLIGALVQGRPIWPLQRSSAGQRTAGTSLDEIRQLTPDGFESFVADTFRRQGYRVEEVGGVGDGGVDLILHGPGGSRHLVQCKLYRVWSVGEPALRDFYGAMAARQTRSEGIVVTCGRFTQPAIEFARGKPIRLIDGDELVAMVQGQNPATPAVAHFTRPNPANPPGSPHEPPTAAVESPPTAAPACPRCAIPMVRRVARKGPHAGKVFWGCPNYPTCRAIINPNPA